MTKKALKALKQSIAHHERLLAGKERDGEAPNGESCPLCRLYGEGGCDGCPVYAKTGKEECDGTPYFSRADVDASLWWTWKNRHKSAGEMARWKRQSRAEIRFLNSLLPKETCNV